MSYLEENVDKQYSDELSIEVAELQSDIKLPELPKEKLSLKVLQEYDAMGKTYDFPFDLYEDMIGNFYIPMLFPLVENGESTELEYDAPQGEVLNGTVQGSGYVERNFVSLMIPKYIVMQFKEKIPKGTKFLVGFVGGNTDINNISIIGLSGHEL